MRGARWPAAWPLALILLAALGVARADDTGARASQAAAPDSQDVVFLGPLRPLLLRLHIAVDGKPFRDLWQQRFDELFGLEDRDHDGRVTVEQADSIARDMNGSLRGNEPIDLKGIADSGGLIERLALAAQIEKALPKFSVRRRSSIARDSALALFPLLDTNHDNQLSADELSAAESQLRQRDFNDDGVVTAGELILDPKAIVAAADPTAADRELKADESAVITVSPATSPTEIADKLLAHYDHNRDGRLTTKAPEIEITLPAPILGRLDGNADGVLDRQELGAFADRAPDLALSFAFGRESTSDRRKRRQRLQADGDIRVRETLKSGYVLEPGDSKIDFKREAGDPRQTNLVEFRTYDRDNNAYIDAAEASNNNIGKTAFAAMDTDSDGKIIKGELTSFMTRQNEAAAVRLQLEVTDLGQNLFEVIDTDSDGVLSPREQRDAKSILAVADKNGDGALAGDELPQHFTFELARGADEAREESVVGARRARSTTKASTSGPLWFRKMDRNNDGDLSLAEFVGPLEAFRKIDANHDGFIDREEAEAASK